MVNHKYRKSIIVDILKALGILLIIMAHICNNDIINQIRSFDVPMLVLISGMLSLNSYKKTKSIGEYYKKEYLGY